MAATQYQVMYRYVNEVTNNVITNNSTEEYEELCEFYNHKHKLISGSNEEKIEAEDAKDVIITQANSADNVKNDMLFAYAGTKKIKSTNFVQKKNGYLVRDWRKIDRALIGDRGDYSKDFVTIGAPTPEDGGLVICKDTAINKYFHDITLNISNANGDLSNSISSYFSESKIIEILTNSTFFQITDVNNYSNFGLAPNSSTYLSYKMSSYPYSETWVNYYQLRNISIENEPMSWLDHNGVTISGFKTATNLFSGFKVLQSQLTQYEIPEHYEETSEYPYLIKDTYVRIKLSPWFVNSTCGSLEAAIQKARQLIGMIGKENVKVIKLVAIDQFIKIS